MIARAESCLYNLINSVEDRTVTVATLKLLKEYSKQYHKLAEMHQGSLNSPRNVGISTAHFLSLRHCEMKAFFTLRDRLECFVGFSKDFKLGNRDFYWHFQNIFFPCIHLHTRF
jgi:hypothetical protein